MLEDNMANGSDHLYKLFENLLSDFDKLWILMRVSGMEPTNNLAERDLRKLVANVLHFIQDAVEFKMA